MKIGIVCYPVKGGSGVVASELGLALSAIGVEVHFFSYALPFRLTGFDEKFIFHQVEVSDYPLFQHSPYTLTLATRLADESRRVGLDIIHAHYAIPHAVSGYIAKQILGGRLPKLITTLHGTDITLVGLDPSFFAVTKFSMEVSDALTTVSRYIYDKTYESFGITKPIKVIHNFVDNERFKPSQKGCDRSIFARPDEKIIMHMSNYRPVKNATDVVRVFKMINDQISSRLVLIGDGPDAPNVLRLADKLGLKDRTLFLGGQDTVETILCKADLFLLPSASEAFGLAALEALASGVPVVGSIVGGLPELVKDGEVGYLAPIADVETMASRSLEILSNPDLHRKMAENARKLTVEKFDTKAVVKQYYDFYEEVLARD
ncbi:MAG: N-acetyl-alpha-D-glucosaminyl L-malate synthase BshA [candidate division Zixibacteria bacterium RBG_16_53_22]|nr:MAG: N-acetyl-alpha-D-glucosaminyl L-malate synthase BshA [candidate division Zixibacteria bacterium RBG_16_53_22]